MKVIIKQTIENDNLEIVKIFDCEMEQTLSMELIMSNLELEYNDIASYQIVVKSKSEIYIYEKTFFGKYLKYKFVIFDYNQAIYDDNTEDNV